ncbi:alpha/beta fold hydrolase [Melissospora conviva]|uniref:thioesterase II family protein n=1 Tax=Melissospora conviva TaxID=3388432 RepID=UPI003B815BEE
MLVIPHAGGSPAAFDALTRRLEPDVEVWTAHLPGRGRRTTEPPPSDLAEITAALFDAMSEDAGRITVLFGHSMGGLIAFELARLLRRKGRPLPRHLVVSAAAPPHAAPTSPPLHQLEDPQLLAWLATLGGMPEEVLADEGLLSRLIEVTRADLRAYETHRLVPESPLPVRLTAFAGAADRQAPESEVARWNVYTSAGFELRVFPGGHFYFEPDPTDCAQAIRQLCQPETRAPVAVEAAVAVTPDVPASEQTIQRVAKVWSGLLGVADLGPYDDFFGQGGHSLLATQMTFRCSAEFGVEVPVHVIFDEPVLARYASEVERIAVGAVSDTSAPTAQVGDLAALLDEFDRDASDAERAPGRRQS